MIHHKVEEPRQFPGRGLRRIGLLWSGQKMQVFPGGGHHAIEQGNVQAVKVLERIEEPKLWPQIQVKGGVANGSEIQQSYVTMAFLQCQGGVDGGGRATRASLGTQE